MIKQAASYFDDGFKALFKLYGERKLTLEEFEKLMHELKTIAETNCRKDIICAFDMGFKHGVFWHIETTTIEKEFDKPNGVEYYRHNFEGGEQ
jgi:hypothetical protein